MLCLRNRTYPEPGFDGCGFSEPELEQDHRVGCSSGRPRAERCKFDPRRRSWQRREACRECRAGRESGTRGCPTFDAGDRAGAAEGEGHRAPKLPRWGPLCAPAPTVPHPGIAPRNRPLPADSTPHVRTPDAHLRADVPMGWLRKLGLLPSTARPLWCVR
jgi:hypothetical protein